MLLEAGVSLEQQDRDGRTPLHLACTMCGKGMTRGDGHVFIIDILQSNYALTSAQDNYGYRPMAYLPAGVKALGIKTPSVDGTGIVKLIPHASPEVQDLIQKLLVYNPDNRITASQAIKHAWFRDLREQEYVLKHQYAGSLTQSSVRATFADSLSQYSKHSDDMGGHGTELEVRSTHHIKGIYSNKKKHNEKQEQFPNAPKRASNSSTLMSAFSSTSSAILTRQGGFKNGRGGFERFLCWGRGGKQKKRRSEKLFFSLRFSRIQDLG